jgi:hypothetical protein
MLGLMLRFEDTYFPNAALIPPCAATVCDRVGKSLDTHAVLSPASVRPTAARRPAPPAPTTIALLQLAFPQRVFRNPLFNALVVMVNDRQFRTLRIGRSRQSSSRLCGSQEGATWTKSSPLQCARKDMHIRIECGVKWEVEDDIVSGNKRFALAVRETVPEDPSPGESNPRL